MAAEKICILVLLLCSSIETFSMAIPAEDLTFDDLVKTVEPLTRKSLSSRAVLKLPTGIFDPRTLPLQELSASDNPSIHLFDVISSYRGKNNLDDLETKYRQNMINHDIALLPEPFNTRENLPRDTKLQILIRTCSNGAHYIVKHFVFGTNCKASIFTQAVYGKAHIYRWRAANPVTGRPQKDQIWIWGAVLQNNINTHFLFRILDHPLDSLDGKPRGHKEMLRNIKSLGMASGDVFVSDKWKATVSALKVFREESGLTTRTLPHEIVNHSQWEIVNAHGYSTKPIGAKWSVIKRWIRKRNGGVLPAHGDRNKWTKLI